AGTSDAPCPAPEGHGKRRVARCGVLAGCGALVLADGSRAPAIAAEFNSQFQAAVDRACPSSPGPNLSAVCARIDNDAGPVGSFSAMGSSPDGGRVGGIEERLQSLRQSKEEHLRNDGRGVYAANTARQLAQSDALQLPLQTRPTRDVVFGLGPGIGAFLSAGASYLSHHNNRFEDGYEAQLPTVTVGADYRINPWLAAGLAFNYTNYDGTYDDGGGFDRHIFGPLLYATLTPFQGAFANLVLGYARQENSNDRFAFVTPEEGPADERIGGRTSADYSADQYLAGVVAGYDRPFGKVMAGPRLGLAFSREDYGNIKEEGDTGLELRYSNLDQTSVQSSLGLQASVAFETAHALVVPQASAAWVHEYAGSSRNIDAGLVDDSDAVTFSFNREPPARDWASIGLGVSGLLDNGLQPFVQFATIQGNRHFVSYGGSVGIRLGL
ncbi:MAG TPA: autotransporter outer membrane beta-barrel domain-containing protein, partial [Rhodospirillales bacterium]|nr:autotransporter outer membrane beta-barrel domain-containing protein [Rhodospirillales bacterium]